MTGAMAIFPQTEHLLELSKVFPLVDLSRTTAGTDPSSVYEELREKWGNVAPVQMEPGVPAWLVQGHEEFATVARNEQAFSRDTKHWRQHREGLPKGAAIRAYAPPKKPASSFHHDGETRARLRRPLDTPRGAEWRRRRRADESLGRRHAGNGIGRPSSNRERAHQHRQTRPHS